MEKAVHQGLIKHIGISNYTGALILDCLAYAKIHPSVLQVEHHPYLTQPKLYLSFPGHSTPSTNVFFAVWGLEADFSIQLAKENDIAVTGYSSFGPLSFRELDWKKANDAQPLFEADPVVAAAKEHNKTPAQVLLRWATQRGVCVIPKSNDPERLSQNLDCCGFDLTQDEIKAISALDKGLRFNDPSDYSTIKLFA